MTETKSPRFDFAPVSCKQGLTLQTLIFQHETQTFLGLKLKKKVWRLLFFKKLVSINK